MTWHKPAFHKLAFIFTQPCCRRRCSHRGVSHNFVAESTQFAADIAEAVIIFVLWLVAMPTNFIGTSKQWPSLLILRLPSNHQELLRIIISNSSEFVSEISRIVWLRSVIRYHRRSGRSGIRQLPWDPL